MLDGSTSTGQGVVAPGAAVVDGGSEGPPGEATDNFVGTFRTKEDAEKGFKDLVSARDKNDTTAKALQAKLDALGTNRDILEKVTELAANSSNGKSQHQESADDMKARKLAEWKDKGEEAIFEDFLAMSQDVENAVEAKAVKMLEERMAPILAKQSEFAERFRDSDPDAVAIKEMAETYGLDAADPDQRAALKKMVAAQPKKTHPDRPEIPSAGGSPALTTQTKTVKALAPEAQQALLDSGEVTQAELDKMMAKRAGAKQ